MWREHEDKLNLRLPVDRLQFWVSFLRRRNAISGGTAYVSAISAIGPMRCQCRSNNPQKCRSKIPHFVGLQSSIAAWRFDVAEGIKIEIDNGLQRLGSRVVAEVFWQGLAPGSVFGLEGEEFGDRITPSLRSGASIDGPAIADQGSYLLVLPTGAIPCLSFGVAESVAPLRAAASWHGVSSVT